MKRTAAKPRLGSRRLRARWRLLRRGGCAAYVVRPLLALLLLLLLFAFLLSALKNRGASGSAFERASRGAEARELLDKH